MSKPLRDYRVLTFDCYGTLIDWESGIWDAFQPLISANGRNDIARKRLLEAFGQAESRREARTPSQAYPRILEAVHRDVAAAFDLDSDPELDRAFGASVPHWPAFPDSAQALRSLKQHFRLVILSNVHRQGFAASNLKLGVEFDDVCTAEDIGSYKPDPANFRFLLDRLRDRYGIAPDEVLHTAQSLYHDHLPARSLGLATAWIDRQRLSESGDWGATARVEERPEPDFLFFSMGEMAAALDADI